ncbi:MAG: hypothetical protein FWF92_09765 [Oscillospiraceae bacterium]|nr:hypothetical protein [Oscillospiraceae bacterium]
MDNQNAQQVNAVNAPSVYYLKCPFCGSNNLRVLGKKGALGASIAIGGMFGAVGNLVADSISQDNFTYEPTNYKCEACKQKFEALPLAAQPDEILTEPCKIVFTRASSFVGMWVSQTVWMNGVKLGSIKNGKTIEFMTMTKYNTLFVTDQYGVAFKGDYKFEAQPGGITQVRFKRKFL